MPVQVAVGAAVALALAVLVILTAVATAAAYLARQRAAGPPTLLRIKPMPFSASAAWQGWTWGQEQ